MGVLLCHSELMVLARLSSQFAPGDCLAPAPTGWDCWLPLQWCRSKLWSSRLHSRCSHGATSPALLLSGGATTRTKAGMLGKH